MSEELKVCPFCGNEGRIVCVSSNETGAEPVYYAICDNCQTTGMTCNTEHEAIKAWNRREPISKLVEEIDMGQQCIGSIYNVGYNHALGWMLDLLTGGRPDAK